MTKKTQTVPNDRKDNLELDAEFRFAMRSTRRHLQQLIVDGLSPAIVLQAAAAEASVAMQSLYGSSAAAQALRKLADEAANAQELTQRDIDLAIAPAQGRA